VKNQPRPSASKFSVLRQLCNLIPSHLVPKLARETGVDKTCRTFSAWSHVVAMLYAQLTHSIGLNDVCGALRLHSGPLSAVRGATPPSRNGLSHADKERKAVLAEKLFWAVLGHLQALSPRFETVKAAGLERGEEGAPMHLGFTESDADAEDGALAIRADPDGNENGAIQELAALADLFIAGIQDQVGKTSQRVISPRLEFNIEFGGTVASPAATFLSP